MEKNYYDVLCVSKNATQDEIKKAYRKLSKQYHPDITGGDDTKFKEISEAYSTIGDEQKRKEYDMEQSGRGSGGGFRNPFGGFSFHNFNGFTQMAADVRMNIIIPINDAYFGCSRTVNINGKIISVNIPKGTVNGKLIKVPGMGQRGIDQSGKESAGDLIISIGVRNSDELWLNDNGLLETMCVVNWIDAILGSEMTINIFDREVKFRVPKYTQNGGWTVVSNQGFRKFKSDELGNLKVNFIIKMPKSLTDEQIKLLEKVKERM